MVLDVKDCIKVPQLRYSILAVVQVVILILFCIFTKYGDPKAADGFEGTHVMIFIGFGFLMTFLKKYSYSALGFNWLLASVVVQWALLCQNVFNIDKSGYILLNKFNMLEADIMSATVLITFGAVLGIANGIQLIIISLIETVIACCNLHLLTKIFKAADAGGSIAIHTFGAYFGLGCSLGMRKTKPAAEGDIPHVKLDEPTYTSDVTAMIGSIFLWIYWPSFNSGLVESKTEYDRAVLNTFLSLAAAVVITFFMSALVSPHKGKFDMVHIQNSTLAGGVAVGAICNMHVSPGGAIAVGMGSAILSVLGYRFLTPKLAKFGILDTCGVNNLHGMPGVYSGLLSIIFAFKASSSDYANDLGFVFPAMVKDGDIDARTGGQQAIYQAIGLVATIAIAFVSGLITGFFLRMFGPLEDKERYNDENDWEVPAER